jgi:hypothetical protein
MASTSQIKCAIQITIPGAEPTVLQEFEVPVTFDTKASQIVVDFKTPLVNALLELASEISVTDVSELGKATVAYQ